MTSHEYLKSCLLYTSLMYEVSDKRNLAEKPVKGLAPVERFLERLLRDWKPDAVVCTYMVYPLSLIHI